MKKIKPFNTQKKPKVPYRWLVPVEWIGSGAMLIAAHGGKITKHNCEGLKPPYLLLSNHASMIDFPLAVKATFPHRLSWVISIEEFVGREFWIRGIGGIYKRKFTSDVTVIRHITTVLRKRQMNCVMYPEARFSFVGINEHMNPGIGKLVKIAKCPVVVLIEHANFITNPQWDKSHNRGTRVTADLTQIVTQEEVETLSADEIQKRIEEAFVYDDYQWQYDHKIRIKSKYRANNIHKVLYQCPACGKEFTTNSKNCDIWCEECGARWTMDEYGKLHRTNGDDIFTHVPDWYRWERENVRNEVRSGNYCFSDTARLEHLINAKIGFKAEGTVTLTHDINGFTMTGKLDSGEDFSFNRPVNSMESCHIEFDFHKKGISERGPAIDLCTLSETYFAFPLTKKNHLTKIHFATEELYKLSQEKKKNEES